MGLSGFRFSDRYRKALRSLRSYAGAIAVAASAALSIGVAAAPIAGAEPPTADTYASYVGGKLIEHGKLVIDNRPLYCGRRPTVLDSNLDDYGAAFPGFLILNPRLMSRLSTPVKLWIYAHECGHQFRGPDEVKADCFAVQRGRRQGWLTTRGLNQVCEFIRPAKGSFMHPAGPRRCEIMRQCFADKRVR